MDMGLITQYQQNPSKELEERLLAEHSDYIRSNVNKWKGVLPDSVMDAYGKKYAIQAFKTFDPKKANINTHLYNNLSQVSRLVYKAQNTVRIPESQIQMIGKVNAARDFLADKLDREPTPDEVADHLHLPKQHIAKVIKNQRADFINDSDAEQQFDYGSSDQEKGEQIFAYRQALGKKQQQQFDALTGFGGVNPLSPKQFGAKFKLKPYEVSRLKASFAEGLK